MENVVNAVVNNFADRLSEAIEAVSPAVESMSEISRTVVHETANSGFMYTMVGLGIIGLAWLAVLGIVFSLRRLRREHPLGQQDRNNGNKLSEIIIRWLITAVCVFTIVGFSISLANLSNWVAPTKQVVREIVTEIQK